MELLVGGLFGLEAKMSEVRGRKSGRVRGLMLLWLDGELKRQQASGWRSRKRRLVFFAFVVGGLTIVVTGGWAASLKDS
jgi:hypothetical protein